MVVSNPDPSCGSRIWGGVEVGGLAGCRTALISHALLTTLTPRTTSARHARSAQIPYVLSAALAALFWATLSRQGYADNGAVYPEIEGVSPWAAFIGAFIMLFSARAAGGCTSGHGISGFSLGIKISSAAVPAMFAGGIATAFALRAAGALTCTGHCVW